MASRKTIPNRSFQKKIENLISGLCSFLILLFFTNLVLLFFEMYRNLLLQDFPNPLFLSLLALFIAAAVRMAEAEERGKAAARGAFYQDSIRKELLGPYDLMGPGRDYSNRLANLIFLVVVAAGLLLMGLL